MSCRSIWRLRIKMQTKRLILNFPNVCKNKHIFGSEKLNLLSGYLFTCGRLKASWKWDSGGTCCIALLFCTQSMHTPASILVQEPGCNKSPSHKPEVTAQNKTKHRYLLFPPHLRIWQAEISSRCVFVLQKASPTKKVFQDPAQVSSVYLSYRRIKQEICHCWHKPCWDGGFRDGRAPQECRSSSRHVTTMIFCRCVWGSSASSTHYV